MRTLKEFIRDITVKPLIVFPLVGLAHVVWLVYTVWGTRHADIELLQVLWMLAYTVFWIAACDYRKWGALGYMVLAITNVCIYLFVKNITARELYSSALFPLDDIFSFFLLFFYKRFR